MDRYERKVVLVMTVVFALTILTMLKASGVDLSTFQLNDLLNNKPQKEAASFK